MTDERDEKEIIIINNKTSKEITKFEAAVLSKPLIIMHMLPPSRLPSSLLTLDLPALKMAKTQHNSPLLS